MKSSIKKKLTILGTGMISGFIITNIVLTYLIMIPFSVKLSSFQLNKVAIALSEQNMENLQEFQSYLEYVEEDMNTRVSIVDREGKVYFTTFSTMKRKKYINEESPSYVFFFDNLAKLDTGKSVSISKSVDNNKYGTIRIFLLKKVSQNRYAFLSRTYRSMQNAMEAAIFFEITAGLGLIVLGFFVIRRWSSFFVKPIEQITVAAEHISNLEFNQKVEVLTEDELGKLAKSVNRMSDQLENNVAQLQNDIESRKRLVRNLSHEIKSPVSVIMGYADRIKNIIMQSPEKAVQYSVIISDESSRVDALVKEMLDFSKTEHNDWEPERTRFEAGFFFDGLKKRFYQEFVFLEKAETKSGIVYEDNYEKTDMIDADYILLERAVYNLIRNAATYVTGQPPIIRLSGRTVGDYYEIHVYNSGNTIPEDEISAIWEPFYKVDKVRGRAIKGCGLGLSIVREIIERHQGYYIVRNVDSGVEFVIAVKMWSE